MKLVHEVSNISHNASCMEYVDHEFRIIYVLLILMFIVVYKILCKQVAKILNELKRNSQRVIY